LRQGMSEFFGKIRRKAGAQRCKFKLIAGEATAVADFCNGLASHPEAWNIVLLDSEIPDSGRLFEELRQRRDWKPPEGSGDLSARVFWMIQVMESWFLADPKALEIFYGQGFQGNVLPGDPRNVEKIPKADVLSSLKRATQGTKKGPYHKTKHAPGIFGRIDPSKVRAAAPHCRKIFDDVSEVLSS